MAKLSDLTDEEWFTRLERRRMEQRDTIRSWWQYYDGEQPLYYVAKILEEQQDRFPALTINWCEKLADMMDRRSIVEGFRLRGSDATEDNLWEIWQRNDLDEGQSENTIAKLVTGVSYVMVGPDDDGQALITVETPESVAVEIDSRTGRVIAALKVWKSDPQQALEDMAEMWLPKPDGEGARLITYENKQQVDTKSLAWMAGAQRLQSSPEVPVVPYLNRKRCNQGRSELRALRPVVDAANQVATNMLAGVEHHAVPRKWALNVDPKQFVDKDGNQIPAWKIATGAVWVNPFDEENPDVEPKVGQFSASDLRNFHDTLGVLARIGAGLCDLPPHAFGFGVSDNPPGADSIRAQQDDWISRIERHLVATGNSHERVMRLAAAVEENDPTKMVRLETVWRDPSAPTQQAKSVAAKNNYEAGISDLRQARVDAGYSKTQIDDMERRESDAANAETQRLLRVGADAGAGA